MCFLLRFGFDEAQLARASELATQSQTPVIAEELKNMRPIDRPLLVAPFRDTTPKRFGHLGLSGLACGEGDGACVF